MAVPIKVLIAVDDFMFGFLSTDSNNGASRDFLLRSHIIL